jgi:hypothetical protein
VNCNQILVTVHTPTENQISKQSKKNKATAKNGIRLFMTESVLILKNPLVKTEENFIKSRDEKPAKKKPAKSY